MNIQIVTCPACLNKYNAAVVVCEKRSIQCPHCKYWVEYEELMSIQDKLKNILAPANK